MRRTEKKEKNAKNEKRTKKDFATLAVSKRFLHPVQHVNELDDNFSFSFFLRSLNCFYRGSWLLIFHKLFLLPGLAMKTFSQSGSSWRREECRCENHFSINSHSMNWKLIIFVDRDLCENDVKLTIFGDFEKKRIFYDFWRSSKKFQSIDIIDQLIIIYANFLASSSCSLLSEHQHRFIINNNLIDCVSIKSLFMIGNQFLLKKFFGVNTECSSSIRNIGLN